MERLWVPSGVAVSRRYLRDKETFPALISHTFLTLIFTDISSRYLVLLFRPTHMFQQPTLPVSLPSLHTELSDQHTPLVPSLTRHISLGGLRSRGHGQVQQTSLTQRAEEDKACAGDVFYEVGRHLPIGGRPTPP